MLIDCATCLAPEHACSDCVVTVLLGAIGTTATTDSPVQPAADRAGHALPAAVELDDAEQRALAQLSAAGLVPPLRLVAGGEAGGSAGDSSVTHGKNRNIA